MRNPNGVWTAELEKDVDCPALFSNPDIDSSSVFMRPPRRVGNTVQYSFAPSVEFPLLGVEVTGGFFISCYSSCICRFPLLWFLLLHLLH